MKIFTTKHGPWITPYKLYELLPNTESKPAAITCDNNQIIEIDLDSTEWIVVDLLQPHVIVQLFKDIEFLKEEVYKLRR